MGKVLFLDIDGPMIPGRAYLLRNQTRNPFVTVFDPIAVDMVNKICEDRGYKIVLHSSWIRTKFIGRGDIKGDVHDHLIDQGINPEHLHEDVYCCRDTSWRYDRIKKWLENHPEVTHFVILDDEAPEHGDDIARNVLLIDFDEGLTLKNFRQIVDGTWPRR